MNLNESNKFIINLLQKNEPFIISRMSDNVSKLTVLYLNGILSSKHSQIISNAELYDGIYNITKTVPTYAKIYDNCLKNSVGLACFPTLCNQCQDYFINKYYLPKLYNRILEPFYCILEDIKPWSHYLLGKKVLIINPFVESMKQQLENNFTMFKDNALFLEEQEFIFYKSFQCLAGNKPHSNWFETYIQMCKDIKNLDFDIALLGCGGYGLPLCNFIKSKLNKSAIYVGGGLQLLFGVMGQRWVNFPMWTKIIKDNNCKFIRPSGDEMTNNKEIVEGGCYW